MGIHPGNPLRHKRLGHNQLMASWEKSGSNKGRVRFTNPAFVSRETLCAFVSRETWLADR
jgi:hypothetical protein